MTDLAMATDRTTRDARFASNVGNSVRDGARLVRGLLVVGLVGALLVILISSGCGPPI